MSTKVQYCTKCKTIPRPNEILKGECSTGFQTFILNQQIIYINGSFSSIDQKILMTQLHDIRTLCQEQIINISMLFFTNCEAMALLNYSHHPHLAGGKD